jgi:hypothetical protein
VTPGRPQAIAIVSNRQCDELQEAAALLRTQGVEVRFAGMSSSPRLVDAAFLERFDAVVSIGHTVQKSLARGRPVYCYDRFGGPGYIGPANIDAAEIHNFSGRDRAVQRTPAQLCEEILGGYAAAAAEAAALHRLAAERYRLDLALAGLLHPIVPLAEERTILRDRRSAERKLVRQVVNVQVRYELFTPESAMLAGPRLDFLCIRREVRHSAAIPWFREMGEPTPSLYAVSPLPRPLSLHGEVLAAAELKLAAVAARHERGETAATIHQPSPALARQFPQNPNSGSGRFELKLPLTSSTRQIELIARLSDGSEATFCILHFEPVP